MCKPLIKNDLNALVMDTGVEEEQRFLPVKMVTNIVMLNLALTNELLPNASQGNGHCDDLLGCDSASLAIRVMKEVTPNVLKSHPIS